MKHFIKTWRCIWGSLEMESARSLTVPKNRRAKAKAVTTSFSFTLVLLSQYIRQQLLLQNTQTIWLSVTDVRKRLKGTFCLIIPRQYFCQYATVDTPVTKTRNKNELPDGFYVCLVFLIDFWSGTLKKKNKKINPHNFSPYPDSKCSPIYGDICASERLGNPPLRTLLPWFCMTVKKGLISSLRFLTTIF